MSRMGPHRLGQRPVQQTATNSKYLLVRREGTKRTHNPTPIKVSGTNIRTNKKTAQIRRSLHSSFFVAEAKSSSAQPSKKRTRTRRPSHLALLLRHLCTV
jgi:hypothetical protein